MAEREAEGVADGLGVLEGATWGLDDGETRGLVDEVGLAEGVTKEMVEGLREGVGDDVGDDDDCDEGEGVADSEGEGEAEGLGQATSLCAGFPSVSPSTMAVMTIAATTKTHQTGPPIVA